MSATVYTETTCDRCLVKYREEGSHDVFPPVGWASLSMSVRGEGIGWSNTSERHAMTLCAECHTEIAAALKPFEPKK